MFPHSLTVYEYYINTEKKDWSSWEEKIPNNWKPNTKEFHEIMVPTIDTVRNRFLVQNLLLMKDPILLVGNSGVGKTVLVDGVLLTLDANKISFTINFSAGTSSSGV
jgi:dynein heavy chain